MPKSSTSAKNRYNAAHYTQVKVAVCPDTAAEFKAACSIENVSMATVISRFMSDYTHKSPKNNPVNDYSTRKKRRRAIGLIISQMEQLIFAEECYRDNIPVNLQGGKWHEVAEQSISIMQDIIDALCEIY